jgi:sugar lactone lactonase YvrE
MVRNIKKYKKAVILMILWGLLVPGICTASSGDITHYAGIGDGGDQDGELLSAEFNCPWGIAIDGLGNLVLVDTDNHKIKIVKGNKVETLAGNIYVSDTQNHVIRKISEGMVSTLAGSGKAGYKDEIGKNAQFNSPTGLDLDKKGNLYVADTGNNAIRKVTPLGEVTTVAREFNEPADVVVEESGDGTGIIVLDSGNQLIRRTDSGKATTIAGKRETRLSQTTYIQGGYADGMALLARFNFPKGMIVLQDGTLLIADTWNHRIRGILKDGRVVTVAGIGTPGEKDGPISIASLNAPLDLSYNNGVLYISEMFNNTIRKLNISIEEINNLETDESVLAGITFTMPEDVIQVWFNKKRIEFSDVEPYIENNKVIVPLRAVLEAWGAEVTWRESGREILIANENCRRIFKYGVDPLTIHQGRSLVGLRFLAERMGFQVLWIPEYQAVVIESI